MPPETEMETQQPETQDANAHETSAEDTGAEAATASEVSEAVENESQEQSQQEAAEQTLGENDAQPVEKPVAASAPSPESLQYQELARSHKELVEVLRKREEAELQARARQQAEATQKPRGQWKEKLKHFQTQDAAVLSDVIEAAVAERLGDVDSLKNELNSLRPVMQNVALTTESTRAENTLESAGIPKAEIAQLRGEVQAMITKGYMAPFEELYWAAYAKKSMAAQKKAGTALQAARAATVAPPAPKPAKPMVKSVPVKPKDWNDMSPFARALWISEHY